MQLGKYELIEQLGQGGFGIVYKAEDPTLGRLVALKVLHPQLTVDPRFIGNFKREARLMAMVSNSNVVSIHEIGEVDGRIFIAMQYLPGGNLDQKIKKDGPIPFEEALEITRQIAKGLEAGHRKNLVHRDVKPANILFDEDGNVLIGDFGVAHTVQLSSMGTMSQTSTGVGTPSYRPPELWNGTPPPSPATDQYSLACVFYEMISGKILFDGDTTEQIMVKLLINGPDFDVLESEELKAVLGKAVAKDPKQRYGSMREFLDSLLIVNEKPVPLPEPVNSEDNEEDSANEKIGTDSLLNLIVENYQDAPQLQADEKTESVDRRNPDTISEEISEDIPAGPTAPQFVDNTNQVRDYVWRVGGDVSLKSNPQQMDQIVNDENSNIWKVGTDISSNMVMVDSDQSDNGVENIYIIILFLVVAAIILGRL